jgi:hypothetical protein
VINAATAPALASPRVRSQRFVGVPESALDDRTHCRALLVHIGWLVFLKELRRHAKPGACPVRSRGDLCHSTTANFLSGESVYTKSIVQSTRGLRRAPIGRDCSSGMANLAFEGVLLAVKYSLHLATRRKRRDRMRAAQILDQVILIRLCSPNTKMFI